MPTIDPDVQISYMITDKFSSLFDELQNIQLLNRKTDIWFIEPDKMMITMRPGTAQVGNTITGGTGNGNSFAYIDKTRTKRIYRVYNSKLWYLNSATWTDIANLSANDADFAVYRIPTMIVPGTPTEYTSATDSSVGERIRIDAADVTGAASIGKIAVMTSWAYKGAFGKILSIEAGEYLIEWSGMVYKNLAWAKYRIYDTTSDCLQVNTGSGNDLYFDGITPHTDFSGYATASLRQVFALASTQYVGKTISFNNLVWTFNNWYLFFSGGTINNPLFYNFTGQRSIPWVSGEIIDLFTYKNRLIVLGDSFVAAIQSSGVIDIISTTFWGKRRSAINAGNDIYFLTTNNELVSLSENIALTVIVNDIVKSMTNYTKDFNTSICSGIDGSKMYLYGQVDSVTPGTIIVLDLRYKFFSTYTGLAPSSFLFSNGVTYLFDNATHLCRRFDTTVFTDVGDVEIEQMVSVKDIDNRDPFTMKTFKQIWLWFENFTQELYVDVYRSIDRSNGKYDTKLISIAEVSTTNPAPEIGLWGLWEDVIWWEGILADATYPCFEVIEYGADQANIFKVRITGKDGSPFYLNAMDVKISEYGDKKWYHNPVRTI